MPEFRTIEIDLEIHKRIESERRSLSEPHYVILHRLLDINGSRNGSASPPVAGGRPWSGKGVTLPHGTDVRMEYNGTVHTGRIEDGEWVVEGKRFNSPSAAAGGVAKTKAGKSPSLDGWIYWYVKRPGDYEWVPLSTLRGRSVVTALSDDEL